MDSKTLSVRLAGAALLLLVVAATAFTALTPQSSTDTLIGLAAGRQMAALGHVPHGDTFSFTFAGKTWLNQNWLTHRLQWWVYSHVSPNAVVYAAWLLIAGSLLLVVLATRWRAGTWLGGLAAAALVAFGSWQYLPPRPATTGFFCLAALWALLCAIEGQGARRRWWPVALVLPLLWFWGNAHGSFVFGFAMIAAYGGQWALLRLARPGRLRVSAAQIAGIAAGAAAALALVIFLGPFGLHNLTHGEKITGSQFRLITEWRPPWDRASFPPVWQFWLILGSGLAALAGAWWLRRRAARPGKARARAYATSSEASEEARRIHTTPFDTVLVLGTLAMTLWARRFLPVFLLFAMPMLVTWLRKLTLGAPAFFHRQVRLFTAVVAAFGALALAGATWLRVHDTFAGRGERFAGLDFLERFIGYNNAPRDAVEFLARNSLHVNLLTEYAQGGAIMFNAPQTKLYLDGRAQQLYGDKIFANYRGLFLQEDAPDRAVAAILDGFNYDGTRTVEGRVDGVLLRRTDRLLHLWRSLSRLPDWELVLLSFDSALYLRKDSLPLRELTERARAGRAWWPGTPIAEASRGNVLAALSPPDSTGALAAYREAVARDPSMGLLCDRSIVMLLRHEGRAAEADAFIDSELRRLARPTEGLTEEQRQATLTLLRSLGSAGAPAGGR